MSKMQAISCDGCQKMAPPGYLGGFTCWQIGWLHLYSPEAEEGHDACSWACLATMVAANIAEGVTA